jgi:predicted RNA-binding protein with PUA-like domain
MRRNIVQSKDNAGYKILNKEQQGFPARSSRKHETEDWKLLNYICSNFSTMAHWLVKSEPSTYSFDQLQKDKSTTWDGVRNYAARIHLKSMKKGDEVFFYHSNEGVEIVGIAKVSKEFFPDPTAEGDTWFAVELKPVRKLKKPVSLDAVKKDKRLAEMALVRLGRLSVQPVTDKEWDIVMGMAGEK